MGKRKHESYEARHARLNRIFDDIEESLEESSIDLALVLFANIMVAVGSLVALISGIIKFGWF